MSTYISHTRKRKVLFPYRRRNMAANEQSDNDTLDELLQEKGRIVELDDEVDGDFGHAEDDAAESRGLPLPGKGQLKQKSKSRSGRQAALPLWMQAATLNLFQPDIETETVKTQVENTASCLPLLTGLDTLDLPLNSHGLPHLRRAAHAEYLGEHLGPLPAGFAAMDASRPWIFYWCLVGMSSLGEDVSEYREQLMETVRPLQNPAGGFGGGHGHDSHAACTYATVLALATVGGLEAVDRQTMWRWLGQVKQADGGFRMAINAEEDIRGAYCAMTIITLLNLPLELPPDAPARKVGGLQLFTDNLGEWVGRCQTYEGGMAGAPTNEAHGAYAFCGLACLSILDAPHKSIPKYLDVPALIGWLTSMQTTPEGGFAGRTNKLVDACYSHWVGGCWALIQAAISPLPYQTTTLWDREALTRYLLTCCQQPGKKGGGMRDKPSARPDAYHTNYSLAGLSAAQNLYWYNAEGTATTDEESGRLVAAFNWKAERPGFEELQMLKVDREDLVEFVHPVFVVPFGAVEMAIEQFRSSRL